MMVNYDLSAFDGIATLAIGYDDGNADTDDAADAINISDNADLVDTYVVTADKPLPDTLRLTFITGDDLAGDAIAFDIFSFGLTGDDMGEDPANRVNNAIYRLELEEDGDNSSDFTGTLEYIGLNQVNVLEQSTYEGIDAFGDSNHTDLRRRLRLGGL